MYGVTLHIILLSCYICISSNKTSSRSRLGACTDLCQPNKAIINLKGVWWQERPYKLGTKLKSNNNS